MDSVSSGPTLPTLTRRHPGLALGSFALFAALLVEPLLDLLLALASRHFSSPKAVVPIPRTQWPYARADTSGVARILVPGGSTPK